MLHKREFLNIATKRRKMFQSKFLYFLMVQNFYRIIQNNATKPNFFSYKITFINSQASKQTFFKKMR